MDTIKELTNLNLDLGFTKKVLCSESEQKEFTALKNAKLPFPDDTYFDSTDLNFYRIVDISLTAEEKQQLIQYRQTSYLQSIESHLNFFHVLTVLEIIAGVFVGIYLLIR